MSDTQAWIIGAVAIPVLLTIAGAFLRRSKLRVEFINGWGSQGKDTRLTVHVWNHGDSVAISVRVRAYVDGDVVDDVDGLAISPHDFRPVSLTLPGHYLPSPGNPASLVGRLHVCARGRRWRKRACTTYAPQP